MTRPDPPNAEGDNKHETDEASSSQSPAPVTGRVEICPMDGNCLFHAAFRELKRLSKNGDVSSPRTLRRTVVDWIATRGSEVECADLKLSQWIELETEEDLKQYVSRMGRDGEWGGIIELYALTEMFNVTTCVWEPAGSTGGQRCYTQRHSLEGRRSEKDREPGPETARSSAHLHYNGTSHYSVFVPDSPPMPASVHAADGAPVPASDAEAPTAVGQRASLSPSRQRLSRSGVDSGRNVRSSSARSSGSITSDGTSRKPPKSARTSLDDAHPLPSSQRAHTGSSSSSSSGSDGSSSRPHSPAHSDRSSRRAPSAGVKRRAQAVSATHPMPLRDPLPPRGRQLSTSARRHSAGPSVALRPLTGTAPLRPLSGMSVKLGLRLDRGGALPTRPAHLQRPAGAHLQHAVRV